MVDIIGGVGTTTNLSIGGVLNNSLELVNDSDWVRVNLVAGQTYRIELNGSTGIPSMTDTLLTLRNSAGAQVVQNDDLGGENGSLYSVITFTAATSGVYYLDVGSGVNGTGTGSYALTINDMSAAYTNDRIASQLISGFSGFNNETPRHWNVAPGGTVTFNVAGLAADGAALARAAFQVWRDATGINFAETAAAAQITLDDNLPDAFENDVFANGIITSATINVSTQWLVDQGNTVNSYGFQTYVHEVGHALGLGHGGNYNGDAVYGTSNQYLNDSWQTTVMSYFDQQQNTFLNTSRAFVMTPMVADIIAMQQLYGTVTTTRTGNTVYGFNSTAGNVIFDAAVFNDVAYTIIDNGGTDTLDYSGFAQNQRIDLTAERYSDVGGLTGTVAIARGTVIENATGGAGNDTLLGNAANNVLRGGAGADAMSGFGGSDQFYVDAAGDSVTEAAGGGTADRVFSSVSYALGAGQEIEIFTTTNTAGLGALNLTGNAFNQIMHGNGGANVLNGGGGVDTMAGFGGNDQYYVDAAGDVVTEAAGGGTDRVFTAVSYALGAGQEIEIFTTTNTAGLGALNLTGNALSQTMHGNGGANVLNGGGGNDTMVGFGGNDQYYVDAAGDVVTEAAGGGSDRVFTAVSYTLGAGQEVEIFTTTNTAGAGALNLTGNAFNQTMHGNAGANTLNGGTGNDVISGFGGADIFVFNTALNAATNIDTITDFNAAADTIHLENAIFTLLTSAGGLAANLFKNLNLGAQDADDRILYNDTTGAVIYDANGLTGGGQTQFALLTGSPTVTDADFVVI